MQLELGDQEKLDLVEILEQTYGELNTEIHHAMDHNFRETLRQRRARLESLLKQLGVNLQTAR